MSKESILFLQPGEVMNLFLWSGRLGVVIVKFLWLIISRVRNPTTGCWKSTFLLLGAGQEWPWLWLATIYNVKMTHSEVHVYEKLKRGYIFWRKWKCLHESQYFCNYISVLFTKTIQVSRSFICMWDWFSRVWSFTQTRWCYTLKYQLPKYKTLYFRSWRCKLHVLYILFRKLFNVISWKLLKFPLY